MNVKLGFALAGSAVLLALLVVALLSAPSPAPMPPTESDWIGEYLWSERSVEVVVQAFILLAGALVIVLLIPGREERHG